MIAGVPCLKSQAGVSGLVVEHSIVEQTIAVGFNLVLYDIHASGEQGSQTIASDGNRRGEDHVYSSVTGTPDRGPRGKARLADAGRYSERPVMEHAASGNQWFALFLAL